MTTWRLLQYVSPAGRRAIEDWRKQLPVGERQAYLDTFLKILVKTKKWEPPDIKPLKGKPYQGLTELRWKSVGVPHRIIGYQTGEYEYLMLIGCTHNAGKYIPSDALGDLQKTKIPYIVEPLTSTASQVFSTDERFLMMLTDNITSTFKDAAKKLTGPIKRAFMAHVTNDYFDGSSRKVESYLLRFAHF